MGYIPAVAEQFSTSSVPNNLLAPVGEFRKSVPPYDSVQLSLRTTLDVGVQQHHDEHKVQRRACGLGPRDEKVHTDHDQLIHCNRTNADPLKQSPDKTK